MSNIRLLRTSTFRDALGTGEVHSVEHALLKDMHEVLRWNYFDVDVLLDMETHYLEITHQQASNWKFFFDARIFCHSKNVTADHVTVQERMRGNQVVTLLCDGGMQGASFAEFIQLAIYLFEQKYNLLLLEAPKEYKQDLARWYEIGPAILCDILEYFNVKKTSFVAHGYSAATAVRLLTLAPVKFRPQNILINARLPEGSEFPNDREVEKILQTYEIQCWCILMQRFVNKDNEHVPMIPWLKTSAKMNVSGMAVSFFDYMLKIFKSLSRSKYNRPKYDEILFSDTVSRQNFYLHVLETRNVFVMSDYLLTNVSDFLGINPCLKGIDLLPSEHPHSSLMPSRAPPPQTVTEELPALLALRDSLGLKTEVEEKRTVIEVKRNPLKAALKVLSKQIAAQGSEITVKRRAGQSFNHPITIAQDKEKLSKSRGSRRQSKSGSSLVLARRAALKEQGTLETDAAGELLVQQFQPAEKSSKEVIPEEEMVAMAYAMDESVMDYDTRAAAEQAKAKRESEHISKQVQFSQEAMTSEEKQLEAILEYSKKVT